MGDFLKIVIAGAIAWALWPKKKEKKQYPRGIDPEVESMIIESMEADRVDVCKDIVTSGILEKGLYQFDVMPRGVCVMGEANLDGPVFSFGSDFTKEQADRFMQLSGIQREIAKFDYVVFILENASSSKSTINILDSDETFDPNNTGSGVQGLIDFDGINDYVQLSAGFSAPSESKFKFKLWLDKETGFVNDMGIFDLGSAVDGDSTHFLTCNIKNDLLGFFCYKNVGAPTQANQYSMAGLKDQILECVVTKTGNDGITSFTINGVTQTVAGSNAYTGVNTNDFFGENGSLVYLEDATLWDIRITDASDTILHSWAGQPSGDTDAAWVDTIGICAELLRFDGINDYITLGSAPNITGTAKVTFNLYLDTNVFTSAGQGVSVLHFNTGSSDYLFIRFKASQIHILPKVGVGNSYAITSAMVGIVLSCEVNKTTGAVSSFIINGVTQTNLGTPPGGGPNISAGRFIGAYTAGNDLMDDGVIWDIRVYTPALVHKWPGRPAGNTNDAWADTVGAINGVVNGSPTIRDLPSGTCTINGTVFGSPLTRNIGDAISAPVGKAPANTTEPYQATISYDQINRDFTVNPIRAHHLKFITTSTAQVFNQLKIINSEIAGATSNRLLQIANFVASIRASIIQTIDIPLEEPIILDRNTYFEYTLEGNETVTLIFYYQQLKSADKLRPIDPFDKPPL